MSLPTQTGTQRCRGTQPFHLLSWGTLCIMEGCTLLPATSGNPFRIPHRKSICRISSRAVSLGFGLVVLHAVSRKEDACEWPLGSLPGNVLPLLIRGQQPEPIPLCSLGSQGEPERPDLRIQNQEVGVDLRLAADPIPRRLNPDPHNQSVHKRDQGGAQNASSGVPESALD